MEGTDHLDRLAQLIDIGAAPLAHEQVLLETHSFLGGEAPLEVVGDELDQLAAGQLSLGIHLLPSIKDEAGFRRGPGQ